MSAGRSRASPDSATSAESRPPVEDRPTQAPQGAKPPPTIAPEDSLFNDTPRVSQDVSPQEAPLPAVSGYDILGVLGRGGMGVVYKARHRSLKRLVALKMIVAGAHAGPDQLARFRTEAEAVARLQHPNIVQIYEIGEQGGLPFFSLEFVDGGSLDKKLAGEPQTPRVAAKVVGKLARAMHAAHRSGIIHRDLKPANVLLTKAGNPKITDFGLAKQLDSLSGQTQTGAVLGTPSYMAPEQAAGKIKEIGRATDVYALGAILYEMMTSFPPFKAATPMDTIMQVIAEEPIAPTRFQKKLPRDLETICLKCLAKEPTKRYASAQALADDLQRFLDGKPILARPVGSVERTWRWCRRNPSVAGLMATVAATLLVGTAVAWLFALDAHNSAENARLKEQAAIQSEIKAKDNEQRAKDNEKKANDEKAKTDKALSRAEWLLYASQINLAQQAWESNDAFLANHYLNSTRLDFRGWEYDYLLLLCLGLEPP